MLAVGASGLMSGFHFFFIFNILVISNYWNQTVMMFNFRHVVTLSLMLAFFSEAVWATDCRKTAYTFTYQSEVDQFYRERCDRVKGSVTVTNRNLNYDGLANLSVVEKHLTLSTAVTDISGLRNLTAVGGHLRLQYGTSQTGRSLKNLDSLRRFEYLGGDLDITGTSLERLYLPQLTQIGGTLETGRRNYYYYRNNLKVVDLPNLSSVGNFRMVSGPLYALSLPKLTSVRGDLELISVRLSTLSGLRRLANVGGHLQITANRSLSNCSALAPLLGWPSGPPNDSVGGSITIGDNYAYGDYACMGLDDVLYFYQPVAIPTPPGSSGDCVEDSWNDCTESTTTTVIDPEVPSDEAAATEAEAEADCVLTAWNPCTGSTSSTSATSPSDTSPIEATATAAVCAVDASEIQVTEAYIGLLNRAPDPNGLGYWISQLNRAVLAETSSGRCLQTATFEMKKLTNNIARSPEWTAGLGAYNATTQAGASAVVQEMYQNLFERAATQADLDWWAPQLTGGSTTASEMALNLITAAKDNNEKPADGRVLGFKRQAASYYAQNVPQSYYTSASARNAVKDVNDSESLFESKRATADLVSDVDTESEGEDAPGGGTRLVLTSPSKPVHWGKSERSSVSNAANDAGAFATLADSKATSDTVEVNGATSSSATAGTVNDAPPPLARSPAAPIPSLPLHALLLLMGLFSLVGLHRLRV